VHLARNTATRKWRIGPKNSEKIFGLSDFRWRERFAWGRPGAQHRVYERWPLFLDPERQFKWVSSGD